MTQSNEETKQEFENEMSGLENEWRSAYKDYREEVRDLKIAKIKKSILEI